MKNSNKAAVRIINRVMIIPPETQIIAVTGDNNAESVQFEIPRWYDGTDMGAKEAFIDLETPDGYFDRVVPNRLIDEDKITLEWIVTAAHAAKNGVIKARVRVQSDGFVWQSQTGYFTVSRTFVQEGAPIPEPQITAIDQALTQIEAARQDSIAAAEEARGDGAQAVQIAQDAADAVHAQIDRADADIRAQIDELDVQTREQADTVEAEVRAQAQAAVDDLAATALRTSASKYDFVAPQGNPVQVRAARKSAVVVESDKDCEVQVCGKNLIKRPYPHGTVAQNGITFTPRADGSVLVNGIASGNAYYQVGTNIEQNLPLNTNIVMSGCPKSGSSSSGYYLGLYLCGKWYTDEGNGNSTINAGDRNTPSRIEVAVKQGTVCDNLVFWPQIEIGSAPTPYEPYTGSGTAALTAGVPAEVQAPDSDVTNITASAGTLSVRYNRESMDTLKAITCETADEGAVATIHPVADAPVHVQAKYTAKQHFDWHKVEGKSSQVKTTGKNLLDASAPAYRFEGSGAMEVLNTSKSLLLHENVDKKTITASFELETSNLVWETDGTTNKRIGFETYCTNTTTGVKTYAVSLWNTANTIPTTGTKKVVKTITIFNADGYDAVSPLYVYVQGVKSGTIVISKLQIELGDVATSYEPYSGGHASPSPDWPQPITSNVPAGSYYVPSTAPAGGYWRVDLDGDLGGVRDDNGAMYQDAIEIDEYTGRYRLVRNTKTISIDGVITAMVNTDGYRTGGYNYAYRHLTDKALAVNAVVCTHFQTKVPSSLREGCTSSLNNTSFSITLHDAKTGVTGADSKGEITAKVNAAIAQIVSDTGTPVTIHYALAEPIVTTGQATRVTSISGLTSLPVESMGLTVPDPDHPCEITGVEVARVRACGKNLIDDKMILNRDSRGLSISHVNGCVRVTGTRTSAGWIPIVYDIKLPSGQYTFSRNGNGDEEVFALRGTTQCSDTFLAGKDDAPYAISIGGNVGRTYDLVLYPQLELGTTATPYEPHRGATQTATLPAPLYGLPDAPAMYDSDGWCEDKTGAIELDGTENWRISGKYLPDGSDWYYESTETNALNGTSTPASCTHYPKSSVSNNNTAQGFDMMWGKIRVRWGAEGILDEWKAFLAAEHAAGHPVTIVYQRATPHRLAAPPMHLGGVNPDCHVHGNADSVRAESIEDPKWAKAQLNARQSAAEDTTLANSEKLADIAPADKIALNYIPGLLVHRWGVEIPADGNPECKRLYEAEGMVANAHKGSYNASLRNDFDDVFLMAGRKRLNYDLAGKRILAYEGDAAFKVDGSNGDVFVRQPAHWRKREMLPDGREIRAFADGALAGYEYVPERLIGSFMASAADAASSNNNGTGTMRSICGAEVTPLTIVSLQNFLTKAKNSRCTLLDMDTYADQADMMLIEFANRNMQAMIGNGIASNYYNKTTRPLISETGANRVVIEKVRAANIVAGWNTICIGTTEYGTQKGQYRLVTAVNTLNDTQSEVVFAGAPVDILTTDYVCVTKNRLGQSEGILTGSGYIGINGKSSVKYRGVEDVFGHVFQALLGVLKLGSHPPVYYYCDEPAKYAMSVTEDYREIGRCNIDAEGYIKTVLQNETAPFATSLIADQVGANTVTYWCDYVWRNAQGNEEPSRLRVPFAGGSWADGSYGGPWYLSWYCAPSWPRWPYGSRLLVIPPWGVRGA